MSSCYDPCVYCVMYMVVILSELLLLCNHIIYVHILLTFQKKTSEVRRLTRFFWSQTLTIWHPYRKLFTHMGCKTNARSAFVLHHIRSIHVVVFVYSFFRMNFCNDSYVVNGVGMVLWKQVMFPKSTKHVCSHVSIRNES